MTRPTRPADLPSAVDDCATAVNESWRQRKIPGASGAALPEISLRELRYGTDDYKQTLQLRHRILRAPLGLDLFQENLTVEVHQRHFSLWQTAGSPPDTLLACLVIVPIAPACVKLRQMAVSDRHQRRGLGQQLVTQVEAVLAREGVALIELHARVSAVPFYQSCGYQCVGDIFTEVGIPHQRMSKVLAPVHDR